VQQLAVEQEHVRKETSTQGDRAAHDGLENRKRIGGRAADDPENLSHRSLLIKGLGEIPVAGGEHICELGIRFPQPPDLAFVVSR
jgi:hypothetical protein